LCAATLTAAVYGYVGRGRSNGVADAPTEVSASVYALLACCAALAMLVTLPYFVYGFLNYPGSRFPDGWSYIAYGQYLWDYPRGAEGGLATLYQYAAHLIHTRHIASAQLSVLSLLAIPGDAQSATPLFLLLCIFRFATACAAFARSRDLSLAPTCLFLSLAVLSGWSLNVLLANNFDNALALCFFPGLAALASVLRPTDLGAWATGAISVAALIHIYPEVGVPVCAVVAVIAAERLWSAPVRGWIAPAALALIVAALLVAPYAPELIAFFRTQAGTGLQRSGARPGEGTFSGLLSSSLVWSAFWGLGGELGEARRLMFRTGVSIGLFGLLGAGLVRLARQRAVGLLVGAAFPLAGALAFIVGQAYSYGAYKVILAGWWVLTFAVVLGATWLGTASLWRRAATSVAVLVCLAIPVFAVSRTIREVLWPAKTSMAQFRVVEALPRLVGRQPIGVFIEDWEASEWAVYYLRHARARLGDFSAYLSIPHVRPLLDRADAISWGDVRLILTDAEDPGPVREAQGWNLIWASGAYRLWSTSDRGWAIATDVRAQSGPDLASRGQVVSLDARPARVAVTASRAMNAVLSGDVDVASSAPTSDLALPPGAAPAEHTCRIERALSAKPWSCVFPVAIGDTTVDLEWSLESPQAPPVASDRRPPAIVLSHLQLDTTPGRRSDARARP
jgi:hypothetical protein